MIILDTDANEIVKYFETGCLGFPGCGGNNWHAYCVSCKALTVINYYRDCIDHLERLLTAAALLEETDPEVYEQDLDEWIATHPVRMEAAEENK